MIDHDEAMFIDTLTAVGEVFGQRLTAPRVRLYWEALRDMPAADFQTACSSWVQTGERFPLPAQLREAIHGKPEDRSASAWEALWRAARTVDAYESLYIEDGALRFALEATFRTWALFCASDYSPEMWANKRKEFIAAYRAGLLRQAQAGYTLGIYDAMAGDHGSFGRRYPGYIGRGHDVAKRIPTSLVEQIGAPEVKRLGDGA